MKKQYQIAASLVCGKMTALEKDIKQIEEGGADYIHFDVMDGNFVPRLGLLPELLVEVKKISHLPVDVHLMVADPEKWIGIFVEAGANLVTVHAESCLHLDRALRKIKASGIKAGVALNPSTPLCTLDHICDQLDLVMLMGINPGVVGHKLIPSTLPKISALREKLNSSGSSAIIEIDGGVTFDSSLSMIERGADLLVCGSATIFKGDGRVDQRIRDYQQHLLVGGCEKRK